MDIQTDDQDRLSLDIRTLEAGETLTGAKTFETPLAFDIKRKDSTQVVGQRYMYKLEVPEVGDVAVFVNDSVKGAGAMGIKLHELLDQVAVGDLVDITKTVNVVKGGERAGQTYSLFSVGPAKENSEATVDTEEAEASPSPSEKSQTPAQMISEILKELNLVADEDLILEEIMSKVKILSQENIKKLIVAEAKKKGAI